SGANLLQIAPHLSYLCQSCCQFITCGSCRYFWAGIKMYDLVSGTQILKAFVLFEQVQSSGIFPYAGQKDALKGALASTRTPRMCLSIGLTAAKLGASIANYCEVVEILKSTDPTTNKEVVSGARVLDALLAKSSLSKPMNATGPYSDTIRQKENPQKAKIVAPSAGIHITLPRLLQSREDGPAGPAATADGRNCTIAGTTDTPCELTDNPHPTEDDRLSTICRADIDIRRGDVLSAWAGIRPLVTDPNKSDTQSIARNHIIEVSDSRMVTIAGGKWTTYRQMSEETIDKVIEVANLQAKGPCKTKGLLLEWRLSLGPNLFIRLVQEYGVEPLRGSAPGQCLWGQVFGGALGHQRVRLPGVDILARRTRLAFANVHAAVEALPRVVQIMGEELGWSETKRQEELAHCKRFLRMEAAQIMDMIDEVDLNRNGRIEMSEFLQFMSAAKSGTVGSSRFKHVLDRTSHSDKDHVISVDRSGGGV
uniref:glycerol-3-phosphate dehydrogenase n=1 Tax=Macrostomum lignano TaxID=282301 RepID=A0A1I8IQQ7_9PLAT